MVSKGNIPALKKSTALSAPPMGSRQISTELVRQRPRMSSFYPALGVEHHRIGKPFTTRTAGNGKKKTTATRKAPPPLCVMASRSAFLSGRQRARGAATRRAPRSAFPIYLFWPARNLAHRALAASTSRALPSALITRLLPATGGAWVPGAVFAGAALPLFLPFAWAA